MFCPKTAKKLATRVVVKDVQEVTIHQGSPSHTLELRLGRPSRSPAKILSTVASSRTGPPWHWTRYFGTKLQLFIIWHCLEVNVWNIMLMYQITKIISPFPILLLSRGHNHLWPRGPYLVSAISTVETDSVAWFHEIIAFGESVCYVQARTNSF